MYTDVAPTTLTAVGKRIGRVARTSEVIRESRAVPAMIMQGDNIR